MVFTWKIIRHHHLKTHNSFRMGEDITKQEAYFMEQDHRPWGYYKVLADAPDHKVKRIVVYPGKRLSLPRHRLRAEHWYILCGKGAVSLDDRMLYLEAALPSKGMVRRCAPIFTWPILQSGCGWSFSEG